jgi:hypothetical protein
MAGRHWRAAPRTRRRRPVSEALAAGTGGPNLRPGGRRGRACAPMRRRSPTRCASSLRMSAATWRCSGADDSAAPGLHSQRHMLRSSASACLRGATRRAGMQGPSGMHSQGLYCLRQSAAGAPAERPVRTAGLQGKDPAWQPSTDRACAAAQPSRARRSGYRQGRVRLLQGQAAWASWCMLAPGCSAWYSAHRCGLALAAAEISVRASTLRPEPCMLQRSLALASRCRSDGRDPAKIYIFFLLHYYVRQAVPRVSHKWAAGAPGPHALQRSVASASRRSASARSTLNAGPHSPASGAPPAPSSSPIRSAWTRV